MIKVQQIHPEAIGTSDFSVTVNPSVYVDSDGNVIFLTGQDSALLVRPDKDAVIFKKGRAAS